MFFSVMGWPFTVWVFVGRALALRELEVVEADVPVLCQGFMCWYYLEGCLYKV